MLVPITVFVTRAVPKVLVNRLVQTVEPEGFKMPVVRCRTTTALLLQLLVTGLDQTNTNVVALGIGWETVCLSSFVPNLKELVQDEMKVHITLFVTVSVATRLVTLPEELVTTTV